MRPGITPVRAPRYANTMVLLFQEFLLGKGGTSDWDI